METQIYTFFHTHPFYTSIVGFVLATIYAIVFHKDKIIALGLNFSQFLRKTFGGKVEKEVESFIDAFDQGLHSDDTDEVKVAMKEKLIENSDILKIKIPGEK